MFLETLLKILTQATPLKMKGLIRKCKVKYNFNNPATVISKLKDRYLNDIFLWLTYAKGLIHISLN